MSVMRSAALFSVAALSLHVQAGALPWYSELLGSSQATLNSDSSSSSSAYHEFKQPIKRAAVIGAGSAGLQYAVYLREAGISVRLFERHSHPGGNWFYQEQAPLPEKYPQPPAVEANFIPDLGPHPELLSQGGYSKIYAEGEDGLTLRERVLEHAPPSPVWANLHTNSASGITHFITHPYQPGESWELSQWRIRRHVRSYAADNELGVGDGDVYNATSYNTRVEKLEKVGEGWRLTLRKFELLPRTKQLEVTWWTEDFDAVVSAAGGGTPIVPDIAGAGDWAAAYPGNFYHGRHYRRPENYANQTVLIVGASISGSEIARDLFPHTKKIYSSTKDNNSTRSSIGRRLAFGRIPIGVHHVPEIGQFEKPRKGAPIQEGKVHLKNGTILTGFDSVILATGYTISWPHLGKFHNDTIPASEDPKDVEVTPIVVANGRQLRSIYLGSFYIADPTLVVSATRSWNVGSFSATAVARVWSGKARLPSLERLWKEYYALTRAAGGFGADQSRGIGFGAPITEYLFRKLVGWINSEAVIFGGAQLSIYPREWREQWVHFAKVHWGPEFPVSLQDFIDADGTGEDALGKRAFINEVVEATNNW